MKTLTKIVLALVLFATALAARAEWVNGYTRTDGTYVSGHYRSTPSPSWSTLPTYRSTLSYPANRTVTDNLSYRGYGTVRVRRY